MGGIFEQDDYKPDDYVPLNDPPGFYGANTPLRAGCHKAIAPHE